MNKKEFHHFFANGKKYDLLKDAKFVYFNRNTSFKNKASYDFVYHIFDSDFRGHRSSTFVSLNFLFDPLFYFCYKTRTKIGNITSKEIRSIDHCPHAILSKMKSLSNYYFSCRKKIISKEFLIEKMEKRLNSYWEYEHRDEFYITYEELYNL